MLLGDLPGVGVVSDEAVDVAMAQCPAPVSRHPGASIHVEWISWRPSAGAVASKKMATSEFWSVVRWARHDGLQPQELSDPGRVQSLHPGKGMWRIFTPERY